MTDEPETPEKPPAEAARERARLTTGGRRTDGGGRCTLLVVHEADGSWTVHGLGAPGVRVGAVDMTTLAEAILERSR